jgi:very-short-patch-repair endonuclease
MRFNLNDPALKQRRRELRRNQTEAEGKLWQLLRKRQFHGMKFFRQYSVGAYILDFYCPLLKLAIELDGSQHLQPENMEYDEIRTDFLLAQGIHVVRFWNNDVLLGTQSVLAKLEEFLPPAGLPESG